MMKGKLFLLGLIVIFSLILGACAPQMEEPVEEAATEGQEAVEDVVEEEETEEEVDMEREFVEKKAFHDEGISVIVPKQNIHGELIVVFDHDIESIPEFQEENGFELIRVIANVTLYELEDDQYENPIMAFDPPIEIRVAYDLSEVEFAGEFQNLKLAYWDHKREKWVILSEPKYEYQILPPSTGQIAEAKIWDWVGDPPIAVGR
jgi:hypothetical protein